MFLEKVIIYWHAFRPYSYSSNLWSIESDWSDCAPQKEVVFSSQPKSHLEARLWFHHLLLSVLRNPFMPGPVLWIDSKKFSGVLSSRRKQHTFISNGGCRTLWESAWPSSPLFGLFE